MVQTRLIQVTHPGKLRAGQLVEIPGQLGPPVPETYHRDLVRHHDLLLGPLASRLAVAGHPAPLPDSSAHGVNNRIFKSRPNDMRSI